MKAEHLSTFYFTLTQFVFYTLHSYLLMHTFSRNGFGHFFEVYTLVFLLHFFLLFTETILVQNLKSQKPQFSTLLDFFFKNSKKAQKTSLSVMY